MNWIIVLILGLIIGGIAGYTILALFYINWCEDCGYKKFRNIFEEEDIIFLKTLGKELCSQDNLATAKPLFHQIKDWGYEYGYDPDYSDDIAIVLGDEYEPFHEIEKAKQQLEEWYEPEGDNLTKLKECETFSDIEQWCKGRDIQCTITGYQKKERYQNAFLTRKACEKHIQQNYYHYNQGKETICYTNHGWRNPELERLLDIVEKISKKMR